MKSAAPINDFNLSVCWNKRFDEDLASSALRKQVVACNAAVKWMMLIIYGDRHVCAPSNSFAPPPSHLHTHIYPHYTLQTSTLKYTVLWQNDE